MKKLTQLICVPLLLAAVTCSGQTGGTIRVNNNEICVPCGNQEYFSFKPNSTKLTKSGKEYLRNFALIYKTNQSVTDEVLVLIKPLTPGEEEVNKKSIALKRAEAVANFLRNKFAIKVDRALVRETITIDCMGLLRK